MERLFWKIYIQPLPVIVIGMILLVILWAATGNQFGGRLLWKLFNAAVFLGIVAVILYMTVYTRGENPQEPVLAPFQSFLEARTQPELYRTMLMNVFLFLPIGLSLPFVLTRWKFPVLITVVAAFFFSAGIEYIQYHYGLGRCEVDDIIMNTLGALIGCSSHWIARKWKS